MNSLSSVSRVFLYSSRVYSRVYSTNTRMPNYIKALKSTDTKTPDTSNHEKNTIPACYDYMGQYWEHKYILKNYVDYVNKTENKNYEYVDEDEWLRQKAAEHAFKN